MYLFFILSAVFLVAAAQETLQTEADDKNRDEPDAYESFGAPVYGTAKSIAAPKSGYAPVPPLPALPAAYAAYLNGLGYGNLGYGYANAYNRFGALPYTAAPYYNGLGAAYGLGYGVAAPGYGYGAGLPYANGFLGRAATYNAYGYGGYPYGPAGLGYRFGYNGAALRAPLPAPLAGAPAAAAVPAPVPVPAGVPAPLPAPLPAPGAFRPPVLPQGKDGSFRYGYAPVAGQRLIWKK